MIHFKNVTATYQQGAGIKDFTLEVEKGSLVFLTGPTGAGKSTVLNCLFGMTEIQRGNLMLEGVDISQISIKQIQKLRRKVGFIFQDYKLIPNRTVFENISIVLRINQLPSKHVNHKTNTIMKDLGLSHLSNRYPTELSSGEQQKISIARALVKDPLLILADEPTGNLDQTTANEIVSIFRHTCNNGSTLLVSTHDTSFIDMDKDQVVKMENGVRLIA